MASFTHISNHQVLSLTFSPHDIVEYFFIIYCRYGKLQLDTYCLPSLYIYDTNMYKKVTDHHHQSSFNVTNPNYGCVSATLLSNCGMAHGHIDDSD